MLISLLYKEVDNPGAVWLCRGYQGSGLYFYSFGVSCDFHLQLHSLVPGGCLSFCLACQSVGSRKEMDVRDKNIDTLPNPVSSCKQEFSWSCGYISLANF